MGEGEGWEREEGMYYADCEWVGEGRGERVCVCGERNYRRYTFGKSIELDPSSMLAATTRARKSLAKVH